MTPQIMRDTELQVLRRLGFKIGEGSLEEIDQIMRIHEKIITFVETSSILKMSEISEKSSNQIKETAIFLASYSIIMQKYFKSTANAAEIACASLFMSLKVFEKKSGL